MGSAPPFTFRTYSTQQPFSEGEKRFISAILAKRSTPLNCGFLLLLLIVRFCSSFVFYHPRSVADIVIRHHNTIRGLSSFCSSLLLAVVLGGWIGEKTKGGGLGPIVHLGGDIMSD